MTSEDEFLEAQAKAIREHIKLQEELAKRWAEEPWPDLLKVLDA